MNTLQEAACRHALCTGRRHGFADAAFAELPRCAAGVYAVWQADELVYVGMAGRGKSADDLRTSTKAGGLLNRLRAHASGRRSGDQFCVYVCDRLVLPGLSPEDLQAVGAGHLSLDVLTRDYVRNHLTFSYHVLPDGRVAHAVETSIRMTGLGVQATPPRLNPHY